MQAVRGLMLAGVVLLLASSQGFGDAKEDAAKALLGKWRAKQTIGDKQISGEISFQKNGKLEMVVKTPTETIKFGGKYKVIDAETLEITITFKDKTTIEKSKFKVTKDTLTMTDKKMTQKFTRVK